MRFDAGRDFITESLAVSLNRKAPPERGCRPTEADLFDVSETAEDNPYYEDPEKGARANHEYDCPAARPLLSGSR